MIDLSTLAVSEYQYYEFVAVDRPLDEGQLRELHALSTRAQITSTSFVNEYHWGDFRGDPRTLMERYFDAFLYLANWGTRRLMIRLPATLLDVDTARLYCVGDMATAWAAGDHVIIEVVSEWQSGDWVAGEGWLTSIIPARADLAAGDLRALYLVWLLSVQRDELDYDEVEPPVPPGLQTLTASLSSLVDFLRIDQDLLAVATNACAPLEVEDRSDADLAPWVKELPEPERTALILRVVQGVAVSVRAELLRRFRGPVTVNAGHRTVGGLLDAAGIRRAEREQLAAERRAQVRARREREAAIAREERLESLARQEEQAWQRVSALIDTKQQGEYDAAVALLRDLQAVGERTDRAEVFDQRIQLLRDAHRRKPSLMDRLDRAGLGQ